MSILNIDMEQTNANAQNNIKFNDYLDYIADFIQTHYVSQAYHLRDLRIGMIIKTKHRYEPYCYTFEYIMYNNAIETKKAIRSNINNIWVKIKTSLLASQNINIDVCDVEYIGWNNGRGTHKFYFDSFNSN